MEWTYLVSSTQTVHSTYLVRAKCFIKEVDSRHLAPENPFFVDIRCTTNITLVKRLKKIVIVFKHHLQCMYIVIPNFSFVKSISQKKAFILKSPPSFFRGWKRQNVGVLKVSACSFQGSNLILFWVSCYTIKWLLYFCHIFIE